MSLTYDFCHFCGAAFPPREGEGHCPKWWECLANQEYKTGRDDERRAGLGIPLLKGRPS